MNDQHRKIKTELKKLEGKDYINAITTLMEFVIPKLNRSEINSMK
jgi:hypothetical protein